MRRCYLRELARRRVEALQLRAAAVRDGREAGRARRRQARVVRRRVDHYARNGRRRRAARLRLHLLAHQQAERVERSEPTRSLRAVRPGARARRRVHRARLARPNCARLRHLTHSAYVREDADADAEESSMYEYINVFVLLDCTQM